MMEDRAPLHQKRTVCTPLEGLQQLAKHPIRYFACRVIVAMVQRWNSTDEDMNDERACEHLHQVYATAGVSIPTQLFKCDHSLAGFTSSTLVQGFAAWASHIQRHSQP